MARTPMTIAQIPQSYSDTTLDVSTLNAFDNTNGMTAPATGNIIFRIKNPTAGSVNVTIASSADSTGRTDITFATYALAAGADRIFPLFHALGWQQTDATIHFDASATGLTYLAMQLPAGN